MKKVLAAFLVLALASPAVVLAQGGGGGGGFGGGGGGGGGGFNMDPATVIQNQVDQIKTASGATDAEWTAIEPKLRAVIAAQTQLAAGTARGGGRGGRGGGAGGGGGGGGGGGPGGGGRGAAADPNNPVSVASVALNQAIADTATTPDALKQKVTALREARKAKQAELTKAQEELQKVVTGKVEAVVVARGLLN